jgi:hypothetical protein
VKALHAAFPGVQVAADALPFANNRRQQSWDRELLADATGPGAPDALIVHFYPGIYEASFNSSELPGLFGDVYSAIDQLTQAVSTLGGKPVWLTEYNMRGPYSEERKEGTNPADLTYAHEVYLAAFAAMLPRVPGLALVDNWDAFASGIFGAWVDPAHPALSPGGQAVAMVDAAGHEATQSFPVYVPGAPSPAGGEPGVVGEAFGHPDGSDAVVLVNLTAQAVNVKAGSQLRAGSDYEQATGNPLQRGTVAAALHSGTVGATGLVLPPYSVTLVGAAEGTPRG